MLRSEIGTDLIKVWFQERKRLFSMTIVNLIVLALLDLRKEEYFKSFSGTKY